MEFYCKWCKKPIEKVRIVDISEVWVHAGEFAPPHKRLACEVNAAWEKNYHRYYKTYGTSLATPDIEDYSQQVRAAKRGLRNLLAKGF